MKRIDNSIMAALLGIVLGVLLTLMSVKVAGFHKEFDGDYNRWGKLNLILQEVERNYVDIINKESMTDAAIVAALAKLIRIQSICRLWSLLSPKRNWQETSRVSVLRSMSPMIQLSYSILLPEVHQRRQACCREIGSSVSMILMSQE